MSRFTPISSNQRGRREPRTALGRFGARIGIFWENHHAWCLRLIYIAFLILVPLFAFKYFNQAYYYDNPDFQIEIPPRSHDVTMDDIEIRNNSLLKADVLKEYIRESIYRSYEKKGVSIPHDEPLKISGYEIVQSDFVETLKQYLPTVSSVEMYFDTSTKKVILTIKERFPIVRLGQRLVVDKEGVVFPPPGMLKDLPEIGLLLEEKAMEPGSRLPAYYNCMIHLVEANNDGKYGSLPSGIKRIQFRGEMPEDGLIVDLHDGRRIRMMWEGMEEEKAPSPKMCELLSDLNRVLSSHDAQYFDRFNAIYGEKKQISAEMPTEK
jgi:hypothetical protein